jgi:hypothetical protein
MTGGVPPALRALLSTKNLPENRIKSGSWDGTDGGTGSSGEAGKREREVTGVLWSPSWSSRCGLLYPSAGGQRQTRLDQDYRCLAVVFRGVGDVWW